MCRTYLCLSTSPYVATRVGLQTPHVSSANYVYQGIKSGYAIRQTYWDKYLQPCRIFEQYESFNDARHNTYRIPEEGKNKLFRRSQNINTIKKVCHFATNKYIIHNDWVSLVFVTLLYM